VAGAKVRARRSHRARRSCCAGSGLWQCPREQRLASRSCIGWTDISGAVADWIWRSREYSGWFRADGGELRLGQPGVGARQQRVRPVRRAAGDP
jgi:hypothetical protein